METFGEFIRRRRKIRGIGLREMAWSKPHPGTQILALDGG
jgi:hypothetical protein